MLVIKKLELVFFAIKPIVFNKQLFSYGHKTHSESTEYSSISNLFCLFVLASVFTQTVHQNGCFSYDLVTFLSMLPGVNS